MAKKVKFSLDPDKGEEGLLSNANVEITGAIFGTYGTHGTENMIVGNREAEDPVLVVEMDVEDGESVKQYFSCGKATRLSPSDDGLDPSDEGPFLCSVGEKASKGLNKNTRAWAFLNSLKKPAEGKLKVDAVKLEDKGVDVLVGLKLHVLRVPAPKMGGLGIIRDEGDQGQQREQTMLVCQQVLELPKGMVGKSAKPVVKKAKDEDEEGEEDEDTEAETGSDDPITEETQTAIVAALETAGSKGIAKDKLVGKILKAVASSKNRKKILDLAQDDDFLAADDAPWTYDADTETLTAA